MTPHDYDFIRKVLKERSGLVLGPDKQYLLESRLLPVVRKGGFGDLTGLIAALRAATMATTIQATRHPISPAGSLSTEARSAKVDDHIEVHLLLQ